MLGLQRHTVEVVDHDPAWAALAADACLAIEAQAGDLLLEIQHVGSTSVPALPAKPILDLAAAITSFDSIPGLIPRLAPLGYLYRGNRLETGGHLFILESRPDFRIIHLHVVLHDSGQWRDYLAFREMLRSREDLRRQYAAVKRRLAALYPGDTAAYTAAKAEFIQCVLKGEL